MEYRKINKIVGWVIFAIAAFTYCMTIEPTASFWDCPEFITTGYKMEVGHPPGAPFFMLTANLFSHFASDASHVAVMVNIMSALLSALCILFLFWTITAIAKKLVAPVNDPTKWQTLMIMGAGAVGALAYTWSDTFWFSAVEGEVYAYSSFCTAITFWLILRWEESADQPHSDKWLVLIAYIIGISVGVHLLNLLCITAIVLVYYFKRYDNITTWGVIGWITLSGLIIAAVLYGIVPGIVKVGGWFELMFVNGFKMPFNSGLVVYLVLLVASIVWSVYETYRAERTVPMYLSFILTIALTGMPFYGHTAGGVVLGIIILAILSWYLLGNRIDEKFKPKARLLNTMMICIMMITIGYSSYAVIVIRSTANPPMDQNSPEDVFTLGEYLAREQYGSRPLFYGQTYNSQVQWERTKEGYSPKTRITGKVWGRKEKASADEKDRYYVVNNKEEYVYAQNMLFPRIYSESHKKEYETWLGGVKGRMVDYDNHGEKIKVKIPTMWDNIRFFFSYQVNFMYWRYFMWNFAGRQNDIQGYGEIENGNWITGFNFLDSMRLGNQHYLPESFRGKGHNVFYCMPLVLGLLGLLWQWRRGQEGKKSAGIVFCLFFMTGLAIVLYLNQTPEQPRERDYAYAGSFYAFAIWIGLGVFALAQILGRYIKDQRYSSIIAIVLGLIVPVQMVSQTWDDHDRSGRYTCRDFGKNYLKSLPKEGYPVIFTNGDNDTFPLWYSHETEGFRTDTRVCNLSYLQTDWYIDQMKRPAYLSPSVPIDFERIDYESGTNDYVYVLPDGKAQLLKSAKGDSDAVAKIYKSFEIKQILNYWIKKYNRIPTDTIYVDLDKKAILRSGMYIPKEYLGATEQETLDKLPDQMVISLKGKRGLLKSEIMMLDMIANCNWERPLYIATTVGQSSCLNLGRHFILEGLAYRISPFDFVKLGYVSDPRYEFVMDTEKMYSNLMDFDLGGLEPGVYLDETCRRMCNTHRRTYVQLANQLIQEGKNDKALDIVNKIDKAFPEEVLAYDYVGFSLDLADCFRMLGYPERCNEIALSMADSQVEYLRWYEKLSARKRGSVRASLKDALSVLYQTISLVEETGLDKDRLEDIQTAFMHYYQLNK